MPHIGDDMQHVKDEHRERHVVAARQLREKLLELRSTRLRLRDACGDGRNAMRNWRGVKSVSCNGKWTSSAASCCTRLSVQHCLNDL